MPVLARLRSLWNVVRGRGAFERDMDEEFRFHLERRADDLAGQGLTPDEARRRARIEFGSLESYKELGRAARGAAWLDATRADMRFAWRSIRRQPLLALAVTTTLTLGIGITTGVFTIVEAILLRPRVQQSPSSFVRLFSSYTSDPKRPGRPGQTTLADFLAFRERARTMRVATASMVFSTALGVDPASVPGLLVSCEFFDVYDSPKPLHGRLLHADDCTRAEPIVVVSEALWRDRLGADPTIVGRALELDGRPLTVVGVVESPTTAALNSAVFWIPYPLATYVGSGWDASDADVPRLTVDARLRPGVSRAAAAAELRVLARDQDRLYPDRTSAVMVTDGSFRENPDARDAVRTILVLVFFPLVALVLIACANVTTLLLARASARQREVAIRLAVGSGGGRLLRTLVTETMLLALLAGAGAVYCAYRVPGLLMAFLLSRPPEFPLTPDWVVFCYVAVVTVACGLIAGLTPARQSLRVDLVQTLKGRRPASARGSASLPFGAALIATQVAMSFVLIVGGWMFARSYGRMGTSTLGYASEELLLAPGPRAPVPGAVRSLDVMHAERDARVRAVPNARSVAYVSTPPVIGGLEVLELDAESSNRLTTNHVSATFFEATGIDILAGRSFTAGDPACASGRSCPVIISQSLARVLWPGEQALGRTLRTVSDARFEVVGVARDASWGWFPEEHAPVLYQPWSADEAGYTMLIRFQGDPDAATRAVTEALRSDGGPSAIVATPIERLRERQSTGMRQLAIVVIVTALLGAALAVIGIYGVVSFAVARRTKEIGVRIALGARTPDIYLLVVRSSIRSIGGGVGAGLLLAGIGAFVMDRALGGPELLDTRDPMTFVGSVALLVTIAAVAVLVPARRALNAHPREALREE